MKKNIKPKVDIEIRHLAMIVEHYNAGGKSQYKPWYKTYDPDHQYRKIDPAALSIDNNRLN